MPKGQIDYGRMVENALRTVVRDVLDRLSRDGIPPPHHFYVTFRTDAPGVEMSAHLRERYPAEMTIVLQHQFWDLDVGDDGFSVTLSFNDVPQHLVIPYSAIKVFADPGAEFGLQFTLEEEHEVVSMTERPAPVTTAALSGPRKPSSAPPDKTADDSSAAEGSENEEQTGGAEIVALDRFRKKTDS